MPPPRSDSVDAGRLVRRLAALARVLDDLPREARRFARWKAGRDAAGAQNAQTGAGRVRRRWPLRMGRPPGGRIGARLWRSDPAARRPRGVREVDEILAHSHALACYALEHPDTS